MADAPTLIDQTQAESVPKGRISPRVGDQMPLEAAGGGPAAAELNRAGEIGVVQGAKTYEDFKAATDDARVQGAISQALNWTNTALYAPADTKDPNSKPGLYTQKGADAATAAPDFVQRFETQMSDIGSKLAPNQKAMFDSWVAQRRAAIVGNGPNQPGEIDKYVAGQSKVEIQQNHSAYMESLATDALNTPDHVVDNLKKMEAASKTFAVRTGSNWQDDFLKSASKLNMGIMGKMLDGGQSERAEQYLEDHKDQFTLEDLEHANKALKEGKLRTDATSQSDAIIDGSKNELEAMEKLRDIKDPDVREHAQTLVEKYYRERETAEKDLREQVYQRASQAVDANPTADPRKVVGVNDWVQMTPEQTEALMKRHENPANDDKAFADFVNKPEADLAGMTRSEYDAYRMRFDSEHRKEADELYKAAQKGPGNPKLTELTAPSKLVDDSFRSLGIVNQAKPVTKFNKDEASAYTRFRQEAQTQIQDFEMTNLGGKRKATGEEIQKILDKMVTKKVFVKGTFGSSEKSVYQLTQDQKGRSFVPIEQIPADERQGIRRVWQRVNAGNAFNNANLSDDQMQRAYAAYLEGDSQAVMSILRGK